uniref:Uncharacterized protein n=1 Tax=Streptomyces sp. NBC_00093 TaxID=2975649 RepID=A0AAU2AEY1_9ACTN
MSHIRSRPAHPAGSLRNPEPAPDPDGPDSVLTRPESGNVPDADLSWTLFLMKEVAKKNQAAVDATQPEDNATSKQRELVKKGCLAAVGGTVAGISRAFMSWAVKTWLDGGGTDG